jgi:molecular chaperone HscB
MSLDYFQLLGLPETFAVDGAALERAFHERSKELHPDRFASAPAAERVTALQRSMAINEAYKALKKPIPRAEYLLGRAGVTIGSNERLDPTFLMEILELREELAHARHAGQRETVARLEATMKSRRDAAVAALTPLFACAEACGRAADGAPAGHRTQSAAGAAGTGETRASCLAEIKTTLILLRYVGRYLEECDAALDEDAA